MATEIDPYSLVECILNYEIMIAILVHFAYNNDI